MNLNRVFLIGRLTDTPQLRVTPGNQSVVNFSVATNRTWTDKSGQKQESSEFHNVVAWGKQAELISKFLNKGSLVYLDGRLQTRSWDDKQGQKRKVTEVVVENVQFGPRPIGKANVNQNSDVSAPAEIPTINVDEEIKAEDLPF
ncbi:MAG: single-stranded DNA-binding protein [Patescibacteria group bacterium]